MPTPLSVSVHSSHPPAVVQTIHISPNPNSRSSAPPSDSSSSSSVQAMDTDSASPLVIHEAPTTQGSAAPSIATTPSAISTDTIVDGSAGAAALESRFQKEFAIDMTRMTQESTRKLIHSPPVQLVFKNISLSFRAEPNKKIPVADRITEKSILDDCSGIFQPGRVCAILGASGAGKTTLVQLVSGHRTWPANLVKKESGTIEVNGESLNEERLRALCAFVYQDDVMYENMSVREIITLAAMLRLPQSMPKEKKLERVEAVIDLLALRRCADTRVGSSSAAGGKGGISGGEKRRTSMALEMINNPSLLFLDEPTSGLDTYTAYSIVRILRTMAKKYHRTVVFTIHQPSSDIFHLFDDLVLMSEGQMMYFGPAADTVKYFNVLGYSCPKYVNVADYLFMNVLNDYKNLKHEVFSEKDGASADNAIEESAEKAAERKKAHEMEKARVSKLLHYWQDSEQGARLKTLIAKPPLLTGLSKSLVSDKDSSASSIVAARAQAPFPVQFRLLYARAVKNLLRDKMILRASFAQLLFFAVLIGLVYLQINNSQGSVQDRNGSLFFFSVQGVMGAMSVNLATFAVERDIFQREFASGMYGLPAFFMSRMFGEVPFRFIINIIYGTVAYWMVGYQQVAGKFFIFLATVVLTDLCGSNIGKAIACAFPNINVALAVGPALMMPMMIFAGLYVNLTTIPPWFNWLSYLSPMRWSFIALAKNEYPGIIFNCNAAQMLPDGQCFVATGEEALINLGFDSQPNILQSLMILLCFASFYVGLAYFMLWRQTKKSS